MPADSCPQAQTAAEGVSGAIQGASEGEVQVWSGQVQGAVFGWGTEGAAEEDEEEVGWPQRSQCGCHPQHAHIFSGNSGELLSIRDAFRIRDQLFPINPVISEGVSKPPCHILTWNLTYYINLASKVWKVQVPNNRCMHKLCLYLCPGNTIPNSKFLLNSWNGCIIHRIREGLL